MTLITGAELEYDRFLSADPANGMLASLNSDGTVSNIVSRSLATSDVSWLAPANSSGTNARRHLFDRPIVSTSMAVFTTIDGEFIGEFSGNAGTATALETSRTIFGQPFNGTADVAGALAATNGTFLGTVAHTLFGPTSGSSNITVFAPGVGQVWLVWAQDTTNGQNGRAMALVTVESNGTLRLTNFVTVNLQFIISGGNVVLDVGATLRNSSGGRLRLF